MYSISVLLFLLAAAIAVASGVTRDLRPVPIPTPGVTRFSNASNSSVVNLGYGIDDHPGLANVVWHVNYLAVLLDDIEGVTSVDCFNDSMTVASSSTGIFQHSAQALPLPSEVLLITTSPGNRDSEGKPMSFLASGIRWGNATSSVVAEGKEMDMPSIAFREFTYPLLFNYSLVEAPGIFGVFPAVVLGLGIDVGAEMPVSTHTNLTLKAPDGHVYLEFVNYDEIRITGWQPQHTSSTGMTEKNVTAHVSPSVAFTAVVRVHPLKGMLGVERRSYCRAEDQKRIWFARASWRR
ncbi:hypothetical protein DL768_002515 [Monosporascus sp. mg162]|nr:hypothetical protein DL768_002515 [Monosporascus sp. mg162]